MPRRPRKKRPKRSSPPGEPRALHYKVVELSNVDEHGLERTVNDWVGQGWTFDGVQFAMRESSKRPSMAFLFFTRLSQEPASSRPTPVDAAPHLVRDSRDAWARLVQLAGEGDEP